MKEIHFEPDSFPQVALLIKEAACFKGQLEEHYVQHIKAPVVALSLEYTKSNTINMTAARQYLSHILPVLKENNVMTLYVADANYFKALTKKSTTEPHYGYVLDCAMDGFTNMKVIYGVNYQALFHNEKLYTKLDLSLKTLNDWLVGTYSDLGSNLIHSAMYVSDPDKMADVLRGLKAHTMLTCDIETYGLKIDEAEIATIAFAWDQHNGVAFDVRDESVKSLFIEFFKTYPGTLIFHNASFDIKCIIYHWFMKNPLDTVNLLEGLHTMYRNIHDTKIIVYLATNSTAGNTLGLKHNAFEFAGNYAQEDINDIRKIPMDQLLEYNLIDCLSTWYVYNKFYPKMVEDQQEELYKTLMLPALKNVTHMELSGMPLNMDTVTKLKDTLESTIENHRRIVFENKAVKDLEWQMQVEAFRHKNMLLKRKVKPLEEFKEQFNPGSNKQVSRLLYDQLGLPVIDTTLTGNPAVGNDTLKSLVDYLKTKYEVTDDDLQDDQP